MSKLTINQEKVLLIALGKLYTEQATYLLGELKQKPKQLFNLSIKHTDMFISEIENALKDDQKIELQEITDALHEGMSNLRNDLIK